MANNGAKEKGIIIQLDQRRSHKAQTDENTSVKNHVPIRVGRALRILPKFLSITVTLVGKMRQSYHLSMM